MNEVVEEGDREAGPEVGAIEVQIADEGEIIWIYLLRLRNAEGIYNTLLGKGRIFLKIMCNSVEIA